MFFIPTNITIGPVKINSPDHLSAVSFGSNYSVGINVSGKKNQGFGQQMADCTLVAIPIGGTLDNDPIDAPSIKINK